MGLRGSHQIRSTSEQNAIATYSVCTARQTPSAPALTLGQFSFARGQHIHDFPPLIRAQPSPLRDFIHAAQTSRAKARTRMNDADIDAGTFDGLSFPNMIRHPTLYLQISCEISRPCREDQTSKIRCVSPSGAASSPAGPAHPAI